jgi:predicted anti-sigma-YlaC factor YlaD
MWNCGQIEERLSGYLDGELPQGERQRVEIHLESCPKCSEAFEELSRLRNAVGQLHFGQLSHENWSEMMNDATIRTSRGAGWILYVVGILLLCGYAGYCFAVDPAVDALVKSGVGAVVLGVSLLFISVLRERLLTRKTDKYEDVQL